jgi:hypothetical protein
MKDHKWFHRFGIAAIATMVALLTAAVLVHATQVITTPNAAFSSFNLEAGGNSAPITPVLGQSVLVMGAVTTLEDLGEGEVVLSRGPADEQGLNWTGLEAPTAFNGGSGITAGFNSTVGTHIVYLDFSHKVDVEIHSATQIMVHNGTAAAATGNVTLIW